MSTHILLIRFFVILAAGFIWPLIAAFFSILIVRGCLQPEKYWLWLLFSKLFIPLILPWFVLSLISTLRKRLGYAFWCAAIPTCVLSLWLNAWFVSQPFAYGIAVGCNSIEEEINLAFWPGLITLVTATGAFLGAVIQINKEPPMTTKIRLIRFFSILAVGALWPLFTAGFLLPFAGWRRFLPCDYLIWVWSSGLFSVPTMLPWFVLSVISTLRNRLGWVFWCAAIPTGVLMFWIHASFISRPAGDGLESLWLIMYPIPVAVITAAGACAGAVIQQIMNRRCKQKLD